MLVLCQKAVFLMLPKFFMHFIKLFVIFPFIYNSNVISKNCGKSEKIARQSCQIGLIHQIRIAFKFLIPNLILALNADPITMPPQVVRCSKNGFWNAQMIVKLQIILLHIQRSNYQIIKFTIELWRTAQIATHVLKKTEGAIICNA